MSRIVMTAACCAAAALATPAKAGDLAYPSRQPYTVQQPLNAFSWAGPYIGANLGYGWGSTTNNPTQPSGFVGGVQAGYNFQSGPIVFGVEGDIQGSTANSTFAPWKFSNPWFGTARGRLGYAFNNALFYGTAGLAFGGLTADRFGAVETQTTLGWTAGVGVEFAFAPNWSAKLEYLYVDLSDTRFALTGVSNGYEFGLVRVGVNYRF